MPDFLQKHMGIIPNEAIKSFCSRGFSLHIFFTLETDLWVQKGRGKLGLSGYVLVKSNIPKSKFYNVFEIKEDYSLKIQNMRNIYLLGFPK